MSKCVLRFMQNHLVSCDCYVVTCESGCGRSLERKDVMFTFSNVFHISALSVTFSVDFDTQLNSDGPLNSDAQKKFF